jgi:Tol biopolymer transport system component
MATLLSGLAILVSGCAAERYTGDACLQPGKRADRDLDPAYFGVYLARTDGRDFQRLFADPCKEMTHARVSPDGQLVAFTRYNARDPANGMATEEGGYENTEIMVGRIDGSGLRSVVPPHPQQIAANSYWTPDGKGLVFIAMRDGRLPAITFVDLASGTLHDTNDVEGQINTDPHKARGKMVFASRPTPDAVNQIWLSEGGSAPPRAITEPDIAEANQRLRKSTAGVGDFDPKLSPDGRSVAFMRRAGKDVWHTMVVDLSTGEERGLSRGDAVDAMPEWSPDGQRLAFWHVDLKNLKQSGVYTMSRDGSDRKRIPLPRGYFYRMPSYVPVSAANPSGDLLIFSAKKEPYL